MTKSISGRTNLRVNTGQLPSGTGITLNRPSGRASSTAVSRTPTTLAVRTPSTTPAGTYTLRVRAHRNRRRGFATVSLIVGKSATEQTAPVSPTTVRAPDAFEISGDLPVSLTPGTGQPLDLILVSRESTDLSISSLDVHVASVGATQAGSTYRCSASDFSIEQFSGAPGFTLPAASQTSLDELGFAPSEWPKVTMRDLPVNQDGCKGASLTLDFSGLATKDSQ